MVCSGVACVLQYRKVQCSISTPPLYSACRRHPIVIQSCVLGVVHDPTQVLDDAKRFRRTVLEIIRGIERDDLTQAQLAATATCANVSDAGVYPCIHGNLARSPSAYMRTVMPLDVPGTLFPSSFVKLVGL